jgi:hypothetical protein
MKTLQLKTGRWYAIPEAGGVRYMPAVPGVTREDVAREIDEEAPPAVTEVIGTGLRLYDVVQLEGEEWTLYGNNAQAIAAAAFRMKETA